MAVMAINRELSNPRSFCVLCAMAARGFVVQFNPGVHLRKAKSVAEIALKQQPFPQYACCSMGCQEATLKLVIAMRGNMVAGNTITAMEKTAIKEARQSLFDALTAIGSAEAFNNQTAENMDYLIYAVWSGLRASMQRQSAAGDIPF
jgi:hypothetical protein